jgi:hypothetical protein
LLRPQLLHTLPRASPIVLLRLFSNHAHDLGQTAADSTLATLSLEMTQICLPVTQSALPLRLSIHELPCLKFAQRNGTQHAAANGGKHHGDKVHHKGADDKKHKHEGKHKNGDKHSNKDKHAQGDKRDDIVELIARKLGRFVEGLDTYDLDMANAHTCTFDCDQCCL